MSVETDVHYGEEHHIRTACGLIIDKDHTIITTDWTELECPRCIKLSQRYESCYPDHPQGFREAGKTPENYHKRGRRRKVRR